MNRNVLIAAGLVAAALAPIASHATVINLQTDVPGSGKGPVFCGAGNATTLSIDKGGYTVVLSGGVDLGPNIANLPADASVLYGTADFANGCNGQTGYTNPLTINFFQEGTSTALNVTNFFVDLYNGNTVPIEYTLEDNLGNSATFTIGDNFSSGQQTFGFAAAGHTFKITAGPSTSSIEWDFFINNIGFNEAIPGTVPEPGTLALLGLAGLIGAQVRRRRSAPAA